MVTLMRCSALMLVLAAITLATSAARAQVGVYEPDGGARPTTAPRPHEHVPTDELRATLEGTRLEIGMGALVVVAGFGLLVGSVVTGVLSEDREPPGLYSFLGRLSGHDDGLFAASIALAGSSLVTMLVGVLAVIVPARERRRGVGQELRTRALHALVTLVVDDRSVLATLRLDW